MIELLTSPEAWVAFVTLTLLEIVLGIDNIVFLTILVGRLPPEHQALGRNLGLGFAMATRILLLFSITWVMGLSRPWFELFGYPVSGKDLILGLGGLFLVAKATIEIHDSLEGPPARGPAGAAVGASLLAVVVQIGLIDVVFSLDSVITAVGLARDIPVMVAAIVIAVLVMMAAAGAIGRFVERHPTVKMLALSFLILIGFALIGEALGLHVPKGYIYFAMAFSAGVEMLNMRLRRRGAPVQLHAVPGEERPPG